MKLLELFEGDVIDFGQKVFDLKDKPTFSTDPRTLRQNQAMKNRATSKSETLSAIEDKKIKETLVKAKGYLHDFFTAYMDAALWSSTDIHTDEPFDINFSIGNISSETMDNMLSNCKEFIRKAGSLLDDVPADNAGHDFWLTSQRHGSGFWDGDYPKEVGEKLTELSHQFPEVNLYIGATGYLYY